MGLGPALALIAIGLLAWKSGALSQLGIPAPVGSSINPPPEGLQANASFSTPPNLAPAPTAPFNAFGVGGGPSVSGGTHANTAGLAISGAASVGIAAVTTPATTSILGGALVGAAAGAAVAGVGVVVAIAAALYAAHVQRKKEATDENSAMNLGVQGYDSALRQVNAAYIARQITATEAIQLCQQIMSNYWAEVTPHMQPGRNGCQGGQSCPPWPASGNGCTGNIGAACCVGCYDLVGGHEPANFSGVGNMYFGILGTIAVLQQGGGQVYYQPVYPSKYGGKQRAAYTLTWVQHAVA